MPAQVIVSKKGDGAELVEDTGLRVQVSHPDGMKRRHAEVVFARLGWYRYGSWANREFGYAAEFRRR